MVHHHHKHAARPFGRPAAPRPQAKGRHLSVKPLYLYAGFGALLATNVLSLVGFFLAPDISRLLTGQAEAVYGAYEDRIAQLRVEVDRLQSRHYAQTGDINLQLQELSQTQEVLMEQHQYVKQLADKAAALGIDAKGPAKSDDSPADGVPVQPGPIETVPPDATLLTGSITPINDPAARVAAAAASLNQMMDDSRLALAALSDEASSKTDQIMGTLAAVGIQPKLPSGTDAEGEGGPLLPPLDAPEASSLVDDANSVAAALDRYSAAMAAAGTAPIHKPINGETRISSVFGNRTDPFTGRPAFHPGIDFAAPEGTTVLSAGAGTVSFVGQINGYGNAVEITHDGGLLTLYGHLSAFLVQEGQKVDTGTPIARVGSTGRSTGPHLHFEVRRSDSTINPAPFLSAGRALQRILAG